MTRQPHSIAATFFALFSTVGLGACGVPLAQPFAGPGYTEGDGVTAQTDGTVLVALTQATVNADTRARFDEIVGEIQEAFTDQPGLIGYSLRAEVIGDEVWTMTVWETEEDMIAFALGDVHWQAIEESDALLVTGRFHNFERDVADIPLSWEEADEELGTVEPRY